MKYLKRISLILSLLAASNANAQNLPINFESNAVTSSDFIDFDGGVGNVVVNPSAGGINLSDSVGRLVRNGGAIYAGSKIALSANLDFSVLSKITMKVYTTAPVGTVVKFKLEGAGTSTEQDVFTTTSGAWETLEWVFAGTPNDLNEIVFMFDFGNIGDGTAASTFYFDDIQQEVGPPAPMPVTLPIDFEAGTVVTSDFIDFAGAGVVVEANPQVNGINLSDSVARMIRNGGDIYAGSKLVMTNNLDFSTSWHITMKVYTDAPVGTRLKLQLEGGANNYGIDVLTTTTGAWETYDWNFDGAPNDHDELVFMFDFGTVGDSTTTSTFLFDDIEKIVGPALPARVAHPLPIDFEASVVTSDFANQFGAIGSVDSNPFVSGINTSPTVGKMLRSGGASWARTLLCLTDNMDFSTTNYIAMKVYTEAPVGTVLKLKVESTTSAAANEKDVMTTVSGDWAYYFWDFTGDPPIYDVITFLFGYGPNNDAGPNSTFYFDDIQLIADTTTAGLESLSETNGLNCFPNPAKDHLTITSDHGTVDLISVFDVLGNEISSTIPNTDSATVFVGDLASGVYVAKVIAGATSESIRFIVE
ncbi:T9SS type A sorting domain-containing protein [Crocinitomicaceae bacterium]|nr:T9SS type A sorting domain-containing protein [Crocinitomicaceae bacterium]